MTAQPPFRKAGHLARRSSTGHGGIRPNVHLSSPIRRQSIAYHDIHRSFTCRAIVAKLAAPLRTQSASSLAALKSP
jgi:hypothetical protein